MSSIQVRGFLRQRPSAERGLTLIELMVTIAIIAVLISVAGPSFTRTTTKGSIEAGSRDLVTDIGFARSIATTRSGSVSLCASDTADNPTCGSGDWNDGWLVFVDLDEDGTLDGDEEIVRSSTGPGDKVEVIFNGVFTVDQNGMLADTREFVFCPSNEDMDDREILARSVFINLGGMARRSRDTDQDGYHESGEDGGRLSCDG